MLHTDWPMGEKGYQLDSPIGYGSFGVVNTN